MVLRSRFCYSREGTRSNIQESLICLPTVSFSVPMHTPIGLFRRKTSLRNTPSKGAVILSRDLPVVQGSLCGGSVLSTLGSGYFVDEGGEVR